MELFLHSNFSIRMDQNRKKKMETGKGMFAQTLGDIDPIFCACA